MTIRVGDKLPTADLQLLDCDGVKTIRSNNFKVSDALTALSSL